MAREILETLKLFTANEIDLVCTAIYNHSDKLLVHGELDEILKDADVMQHVLYNPLFEIKSHQQERFSAMAEEFGLEE